MADADLGSPQNLTSAGLLFAALFDLGLLAAELAEVVELRPADVAASDDLDAIQRRAVDRVGPLDADTEAHLPYGECLAQPGTMASDDHALEDLDTGPVTLDDP